MSIPQVLVFGAGVAGAAAGVLLRRCGYEVTVHSRQASNYSALESLSSAGAQVLGSLGLHHVLPSVGAQYAAGFGGRGFYFFDRRLFANAIRLELVAAGVATVSALRTIRLAQDGDCVCADIGGRMARFDFVVDATGRAARISRPIVVHRLRIADIYSASTCGKPDGQYCRGSDEWAYRLDDGVTQTIGIIGGRRKVRPTLPARYVEVFGTQTERAYFVGRRVASAQWASLPIRNRRVTVGDAALAHEPLAGQGIKFALASARAAVAAIRTILSRPSDAALAYQFYAEFISHNRNGHVRYLNNLEHVTVDSHVAIPIYPHYLIQSIARVETGPIVVDGYVRKSKIIRGTGGAPIRWIGGMDAMLLVRACSAPTTVDDVERRLEGLGIERVAAHKLIEWSVQSGVLKVFQT